MPDTPRGYPYPPGTGVAPAGHLQMQALAETIDQDVTDTEAALDARLDALETLLSGRVFPHREHLQTVNVTIPAGSNTGTAPFTLPAGRFSVAPKVVSSIDNSSSGAFPAAAAGSTMGGTVRVSTAGNVASATTIAVLLHSIQMTPTAALG